MDATRTALRQARRLSRVMEGTAGPAWEESPPGSWLPSPKVEPSATLEEVATLLDGAVGGLVAWHRRTSRVSSILNWVFLAGGCLAVGWLLAVDGPGPLPAVAAVLVAAGFALNRARDANGAVAFHAGVMHELSGALADRVGRMTLADRAAVLAAWQTTHPFVVAWVEGSWSLRSMMHRQEDAEP